MSSLNRKVPATAVALEVLNGRALYHAVWQSCLGVDGALLAVRAKQMRTQFFLQVGKLRVARYRSQEYVVEFVGHVGFQTVADERVDGVLNGKLLHQLVFLLCRFGQRGFGEMLRVVLVPHFLQRAEILRKLGYEPIRVIRLISERQSLLT